MATKKSQITVRPERSGREAAADAKGENDVARLLADLSAQVAALSERLARLEGAAPPSPAKDPLALSVGPRSGPESKGEAPPPVPSISEEEVLAVSAALAAYFGVRMRIRNIRLLSSQAWAQ